ncbi:MAG: thiamine pyrophosphate-dependent dehydrogenase E1 component subunit alpha [Desulfobacterales bacterium]|nr:MAG: thiamine pyrophosphate-dependent dehydrogenase E1 component subunit alpha [Desulfobacterales bacterium]
MKRETPGLSDIPKRTLIKLYKLMLAIRRFEEKIVRVYCDQDMKTPVHLYIGQEAIAAGVCANLRKEDYVFSTHRSHGHYLAKGGDMKRLMAELYGRKTGCSRGKGGSMHVVDPEVGVCGSTAIVGGNIPLSVGAALSSVMQKRKQVAVSFFGDGAVEEGAFHESLNFAALKDLPAVFVCENNFYATHSHQSKRQPHDHIYKLAKHYLMPGFRVDGNDVLRVFGVAREAVNRARRGDGPTLMECRTYRWKGHVGPECDIKLGYRMQKELNSWMKRCPIKRFEKRLVNEGVMKKTTIDKITREIDRQIDDAYRFGKGSPHPDENELLEDVWNLN